MPAWAGGFDNQFGRPHALIKQATATMRSVARLTHSYAGQHFGEIGPVSYTHLTLPTTSRV